MNRYLYRSRKGKIAKSLPKKLFYLDLDGAPPVWGVDKAPMKLLSYLGLESSKRLCGQIVPAAIVNRRQE